MAMDGVQLWKDGPYFATCNVGATSPEKKGYYFWWGDTVGYTHTSGSTFVSSVNSSTTLKFGTANSAAETMDLSVSALQSAGWIDASGNLVAAHDAATAKLGAPWRLMTKAEMDALISNTTKTWTTQNGVNGCLIKGKNDYASNKIFIPVAGVAVAEGIDYSGVGYYMSSTPYGTKYEHFLYFKSGTFERRTDATRRCGYPVRAVHDPSATVTLDRQGGSGGSTSVKATYDVAMPSVTVPTKSGYTFGGYWTGKNGTGTQYYTATGASAHSWDLVVASPTLYAKWTGNPYTVTLDAQGGTGGTASVTATYDAAMPSATMPTKAGYTFAGYFDATTGGTKYYNADGTSATSWDKTAVTTLYAQWEANTYTVTLNPQGGAGGSASVTATYGAAMPSATMPTKAGYTFAGYFDATTGGTKYYNADGTSAKSWDKTGNTTLYAQWALNDVSVTLTAGEGEGYGFAVSNLTAGAEIQVGEDGQYVLPAGAKVGIYAVAKPGYVILAANPLVIEKVDENTRNIVDSDLPRPTVSKPGSGDEPQKVIEKVAGDDGKTYTAVLENKSETGEEVENPVRAMSVEGLGEVASSKKTDVTLSVTPKDVKNVGQDVAEKIDGKLKEASEGKGFDSVAFVDLSVSFNAVKQENCELESVITLHIPWPVRAGGSYGVVRMHNGVAQMIPQGADNAEDGEFFTVDFEKREIVLRVKKFSDYAIAETPPGMKVGENAYALVEDGNCTVYGTGATYNFSKQNPAPWAAFADQIKSVTIEPGVMSIGSRFFKGCTHLGTVTGGKDLVSVGENAFYQCMSLETISLENAAVLDSLKNAIVYQTAIKADGTLYTIPSITLPGYKSVLYGTNYLSDPNSWQPVDSDKTMEASGYHFFKFVLKKIEE